MSFVGMFPFSHTGFHRYLLPLLMLWYFSICQNTTVYIYKCYIRVQVIPRGIPTRNRRWYQLSLYRPIAMHNLNLHETKHALNFSSAFYMLLIYVHSWKPSWWEQVFSKETKKKGVFWCCKVWPKCLKYIPLIWKQELRTCISLLENIMFINFLSFYCLFQT